MARSRALFHAAWLALAVASPGAASGRDSLGMFGTWGAFRDPGVPRCYAIAMAMPSTMKREFQPYATVGSWPRRGERNQVHLRLSRRVPPGGAVTLYIGAQRIALVASGADAWPPDRRVDAAIVAAMRSAPQMTVRARDMLRRPFGNSYQLAGAATAMDAATFGCARG